MVSIDGLPGSNNITGLKDQGPFMKALPVFSRWTFLAVVKHGTRVLQELVSAIQQTIQSVSAHEAL